MVTNQLLQYVIEFGLVYCFYWLFVIIGKMVVQLLSPNGKSSSPVYERLFLHFLAGLLVVISIYSIVVTKGRTVNVLMLPIIYFLLRNPDVDNAVVSEKPQTSRWVIFGETVFICLLSVLILNLFPESEYKQADSFFYLKIAENLNETGQENISHYYNQYNVTFHGMEPYHHFEIWITAFITRFTQSYFPSILIERVVTYGILLTSMLIGLYYLVEAILKKKISGAQKIFCWSLLFILPNVLGYFPWLYNVFVSDFEGNVLERPNFRIIYLLFIPLFVELNYQKSLSLKSVLILLILSVVSFKFTVVLLPGLLLYGAYLVFIKNGSHKNIWLSVILFSIAFGGMYYLFPVSKIPSLYAAKNLDFVWQTIHGFKFIFFSIVTSIIYILLIVVIFLFPLWLMFKNSVFVQLRNWVTQFKFLFFIAVISLLLARILYLKDNAYQFLFITHIIVTWAIWMIYLKTLSTSVKTSHYYLSVIFLSFLWFAKPVFSGEASINTFSQNGNFIYGGVKYSTAYLNQVKTYFKYQPEVIGGYIADSNFYRSTYYSRRNPNVYFLPITYIIAASRNRNFEFCLSDTSALNTELTNPLHYDYLQNAINRSQFFQFRLNNPALNYQQGVEIFIKQYRLQYLFVTKNYNLNGLNKLVRKTFTDANTGERFLVLD